MGNSNLRARDAVAQITNAFFSHAVRGDLIHRAVYLAALPMNVTAMSVFLLALRHHDPKLAEMMLAMTDISLRAITVGYRDFLRHGYSGKFLQQSEDAQYSIWRHIESGPYEPFWKEVAREALQSLDRTTKQRVAPLN